MLTVRTSENTVITSFRLISERQDFSSVRTGENTVRACENSSWRQSHCDYSLRKQNDQQHLSLACYLQAARDRLDMLEGQELETNSNFRVCLRRAGKIESHEILCRQEEYQRLEQILFGTVQAAQNLSPQPKKVLEEQLLWEKDLAKKCKRTAFASIEQAANNYKCLCDEINKRIRQLIHK